MLYFSLVPEKDVVENNGLKKKKYMLAFYYNIMCVCVFFCMNDVFLLFTIKYKEHSSGDTMKGLDCSLLECIQLPGWVCTKKW